MKFVLVVNWTPGGLLAGYLLRRVVRHAATCHLERLPGVDPVTTIRSVWECALCPRPVPV